MGFASTGVIIAVVAVIFADRTATGDPQTLQTFFEHRRVERDQLRDVSRTFDGVLGAQHGVAALRALQARFAVWQRRQPRGDGLGANISLPCFLAGSGAAVGFESNAQPGLARWWF